MEPEIFIKVSVIRSMNDGGEVKLTITSSDIEKLAKAMAVEKSGGSPHGLAVIDSIELRG